MGPPESDTLEPNRAAMSVILSCTEKLEVTLTKTSIKVLNSLMETFSSVVSAGIEGKGATLSPYILKNECGYSVHILIDISDFEVSIFF